MSEGCCGLCTAIHEVLDVGARRWEKGGGQLCRGVIRPQAAHDVWACCLHGLVKGRLCVASSVVTQAGVRQEIPFLQQLLAVVEDVCHAKLPLIKNVQQV